MKSHGLTGNRLVVVAGMARAGTTFLYHNFQRHPDIYVPPRKELAYFAYNYDHGAKWFQSFFRGVKHEKCAVDISPAYFMDEHSPDRIKEYGEGVRVIIGVRRPSEWIYSMYGHYGEVFTVPPFRDFLKGCTVQREGKEYQLEFGSGKIQKTVEHYQDVFKDNLFLYDFNLLKSDPLCLLREMERFIGLTSYYSEDNVLREKVHARGADRGRMISRLLNQSSGLATFVSKVCPPSVLVAVRRALEVSPKKKSDFSTRKTIDSFLTNEDREYAESVLKSDEDFYRSLFRNSPVVKGK